MNGALVIFHHLRRDCQAQPGSFAGRLRGKERLKNLILDLLRDASAGIGNPNSNAVFVKGSIHRQGPPCFFHGMEPIENQIQKQLTHLNLIGIQPLSPAV